LFEYKRLNPHGIYNQTWEDSDMAYLHLDGKVAHADGGLAAIELQGYAYDALLFAADTVAYSVHEAAAWRELAATIQSQTLKLLWMENDAYFAMGLDRNPDNGALRQIATLNLNPALLLETRLLVDLPEDQRQHYLESIVRMAFSDQFVTPAGLRLRAKKHAALLPFADYHGSDVTWPKQTFDVARGLRAHGLPHLAMFLEDCILHSVAEAGEFYEFFFVNGDNRPKYHYRVEHPDEPTGHEFGAANMPDPGQSWTMSAVMAIITRRHRHITAHSRDAKPSELEASILNQPHIKDIAMRIAGRDVFALQAES
jgi:glycogen debranching enzyme